MKNWFHFFVGKVFVFRYWLHRHGRVAIVTWTKVTSESRWQLTSMTSQSSLTEYLTMQNGGIKTLKYRSRLIRLFTFIQIRIFIVQPTP